MTTTDRRQPRSPASTASGRFGLAAIAAVLLAQLPLPWTAAGLVAALVAVVLGIRAAVALAREHGRAAALTWTIVGTCLVGMIGMATASDLVLYPITKAHQDCMDGATTLQAQADCQTAYQQRLRDLIPTGGRQFLSN